MEINMGFFLVLESDLPHKHRTVAAVLEVR